MSRKRGAVRPWIDPATGSPWDGQTVMTGEWPLAMKDAKPVNDESRATTGERSVVARHSKAKAKDYTDPHRHGYKAKGGPIERRHVDPKLYAEVHAMMESGDKEGLAELLRRDAGTVAERLAKRARK